MNGRKKNLVFFQMLRKTKRECKLFSASQVIQSNSILEGFGWERCLYSGIAILFLPGKGGALKFSMTAIRNNPRKGGFQVLG